MPLVTGVTLHAEAEQLLHRNKMHPSYLYRTVMFGHDSRAPLENETTPLPTEEDGWERNHAAEVGGGDPDYYIESWRKLNPMDGDDTIKELYASVGMHLETARALLKRLGKVLATGQRYVLPMRMGAVLLTIETSVHESRGTQIWYEMRMKDGRYSAKQQWMGFTELPLSVEDFLFVFTAPSESFLEQHTQAMLDAYFPEREMSLGVESTIYTTIERTTTGGMRTRTAFEKLTTYVKTDNLCLDILVVTGDETGTEFFPHFVGELWRRLSQQKVMIYALYDAHLEKMEQAAERAKYEFMTTTNHVQTGQPVKPDGEDWYMHDMQAGGRPKLMPGVTHWIRLKPVKAVIVSRSNNGVYEYVTTSHGEDEEPIPPEGTGWRRRDGTITSHVRSDWVRNIE